MGDTSSPVMLPLLQAVDRTGIYVAVAVLAFFAVVGLVLLAWSRAERRRGVYERAEGYVLGLGEPPRLVPVEDASRPPPSRELGRAGLIALAHALDGRGDMMLTHYHFEDAGEPIPVQLERGALDERPLVAIELTDSRGEITIEADGRVTARPALDRAVRRDLEELLGRALGGK